MTGKTDIKNIPDTLLTRLSEYLTAKIGLHFSNRSRNELRQKMATAMTDFGFENVGEFVEWLLASTPTQKQIEILASHLTVGETYFFRERRAFELLEMSVLPALIDARRKTDKRLRFWSAGCSTGEEPYSLAILLDKLIPDLKNWNITILATDINTAALRKADEGIYSDWSFRDTPPSFKEKYFEKVKGSRFRLLPAIRKMVTFSYLNLSEDVYPALQNNTNAMDVIFCRNVLMYFALDSVGQAAERFFRSLVEGGWLVVSPVEISQLTHSPFTMVRFQDSTFYKKDTRKIKPESLIAKYIEKKIVPFPPPKVKPRKSEKPPHTAPYDAPERPKQSALTPLEEAAILYRKGFYREAEESLSALITNGSSSQEMMVLFTKILANQGKLEDAFHWCEKAVSADKCNPVLRYLLAVILEEQNRVEEAKASLKKALYLDRNFSLAHFALANISLRSGKTAEARKHFGNANDILSKVAPDEILPESEGMTAGRLSEIIGAIRLQEIR
ncbi:MAG: CheR family methyltransferase [Pseudomonadota bacterium]